MRIEIDICHKLDSRFEGLLDHLLQKLLKQGDKIMTAISEFATKMTAFTDRQDKAVADLQGDVKSLSDQIAALQASQGTITAEDQALLDGIEAKASTVADKLDALDSLTPPVPPTGP